MILYTFNLFSANDKESVFYGENDKRKRNIVLVGSSNLDCNFDYELLNRYYKDYDVIGSNLNEPSGLFSTIHKLRKLNLTKHDKIVLCLPHSFYEKEKFLPLTSSMKRGFSQEMLWKAITTFPILALQNFWAVMPSDLTNMSLGNEYGRHSSSINFEMTPMNQLNPLYTSCWSNQENKFKIFSPGFDIDYLEQIRIWLDQEFDAEILFRFPEVRDDDFEISNLRLYYLSHNFKFINEFKTSSYPKDLWYDQWYHLNKCGRDLNTQKLIIELNNAIR